MRHATMAKSAVVADPDSGRLAALERRVERLEQAARDRAAGRMDEPALLAALAFRFGAAVFSASDLRRTSSAELRALIGARSTHAIGLALRRISGRTLDGYRLLRVRRAEGGTLWQIARRDPVDG